MTESLPFYSWSDDEYVGLLSENPIRFETLYFEPEEYNSDRSYTPSFSSASAKPDSKFFEIGQLDQLKANYCCSNFLSLISYNIRRVPKNLEIFTSQAAEN